MTDILDTIDELDDDFDLEDDDFEAEVELVDDEDDEMSASEAQEITEAIRSAATATYILLAQAHERKAYKALGYETWADYVKEEFEMSAQRSYQLLDLSKAVAMIEAAVPEGTAVKLTEAQARDIKRELPRITEQLEEATRDKSPEDASADVDRIIDEIREQKKADDKELEKKKQELDAEAESAHQEALESAADALLEADRPEGMTDIADDGLVEVDIAGDGDSNLSPEAAMHIYNFFNVLSGINNLPEPDEFLPMVPEARAEEIDEQVMAASAWLNRFQTLWEMRDN